MNNERFTELMMAMVSQLITSTDPAKTGGSKVTDLIGGRKMFVGLLAIGFAIIVGLFFPQNPMFDAMFVQNIFYGGMAMIVGGNLFEHTTSTARTKSIVTTVVDKMPELLAQAAKVTQASQQLPQDLIMSLSDDASGAVEVYKRQMIANFDSNPDEPKVAL